VNSVDKASCRFDERRSLLPTTTDVAIDVAIGVPFARMCLTNGTRIAFSRAPALSKV
jgi:hypothetical protein